MASLPSVSQIRAAHRNNPDGRLIQTDSDRIAWMDGLPVGTQFAFDTPDCNFTAERRPCGWVVGFYYNGWDAERVCSTWREVIDLLSHPDSHPRAA